MALQGLKRLFLMALILVSCAAPGSDNPAQGCGGTEASVSCLEITSIAPVSAGGGGANSSNVDAFQEFCTDPTTGQVTFESFTDHNAAISFSNMLFPTATTGFDIRVVGYSVSYGLNQCPAAAQGRCPPLTGFTVSSASILIPKGGAVTVTLPFVPLRTKNEFCTAVGKSAGFPSYTATYTFTAQTTGINDMFTVTGSAEFTIGDFADSGFSCTGKVDFARC